MLDLRRGPSPRRHRNTHVRIAGADYYIDRHHLWQLRNTQVVPPWCERGKLKAAVGSNRRVERADDWARQFDPG
jgi:hypothetical protein